MNYLDLIIIAIVLVSALIGAFRGIVREILSVAGWLLGIILAIGCAVPVGKVLPLDLSDLGVNPSHAKTAVAALLLLIGTVVIMMGVSWLVRRMLRAAGLTWLDRVLGPIFGFVRGLLIVFVLVLFAVLTPAVKQPAWRKSVLIKYFEGAVNDVTPYLPRQLQRPAIPPSWNFF